MASTESTTPEKPRHEGEWVAAALQERRRIADALEAEGERLPCREDGEVYESAAWLVRGDFSYNEAERLELAGERHNITPSPAARGTPEGGYFSVVSWKSKGDDLWLYHKASGNKKANLYELALVGEIEALRAERIASPAPAPARGTPEGGRQDPTDAVISRLTDWRSYCLRFQIEGPPDERWGADLLQEAIALILGKDVALQTEREMHNAWRKRAEQSELEFASQARTIAALRAALTTIERSGYDSCAVFAAKVLKEHPNG